MQRHIEFAKTPMDRPSLHSSHFRSAMAYGGGGGPTSEMGFNGEHGKISCLRTASITHGSELSFMEFLDLFKSFRFVTLLCLPEKRGQWLR